MKGKTEVTNAHLFWTRSHDGSASMNHELDRLLVLRWSAGQTYKTKRAQLSGLFF
jgi:hypothetical protein